MSGAEIGFRFARMALTNTERAAVAVGWEPKGPMQVGEMSDALYPFDLDISEISQDFVSSSAGLQRGRIDLFEYGDLDVGRPVRWHVDPLTRVELNAGRFGKGIDYRDEARVGDIKVVWELGRHQFLVPIAVHYLMDQDDRHLSILADVLNSWIEQNPFDKGIHWCSSLEVSLRGMSWAVMHQILRFAGLDRGIFSLAVDETALRTSIYQHAWFIRHYLSLYSSGNNHLIGELTGLLVLTSVFPQGRKGEDWKHFAWNRLLKESAQQVHRDGVGKEQAVYYHAWVLEYFIIAYLTAMSSGLPIPRGFLDTIVAMARFLIDLSPDYKTVGPPQIGDADDGVALAFNDKSASTFFVDLIQTVSMLTCDFPAVETASKAIWYRSMARSAVVNSSVSLGRSAYPVVYPDGGYSILGREDFHLVFDAGPLGFPAIAAHGHADALSICLALDAKWWLIDPGTYAYHSAGDWRGYFRGTRAHNTICINDLDQSLPGGSFLWLRHADAVFDGMQPEDESHRHVASGVIRNYQGAPGVELKRSVVVDVRDSTIHITDQVNCEQETGVSLQFHFAPDIDVEFANKAVCRARRPGEDPYLDFEFDEGISLTLYRGDEDTMFGWCSPSLGTKVPCFTLVAQTTIKEPTVLNTRLRVVGG